jgi:hypothetical protein
MKKTICILITCIIVYTSGCTYETVETALCDNPPGIELVLTTDSECNAAVGKIEVIGTGGLGILEYSRDGINFQSSPIFENLALGIYQITVRDEKACLATLDTEIKNANGLNIDVAVSPSGCGVSGGSVSITATGGNTPYQFKLGQGSFSANSQFNNLTSGSYDVVAKDAGGCTIERKVVVLTGEEFSAIKSIITTNCATSSCHGGNVSPDFRKDQNIVANASNIATRTGNKSMPPSGSISDNQIKSIACWVKDGGTAK